ncbi:hypothetical protein PVL29_014674 [Vitis rotundifolia]|uniref:Uncharacterized protein n=1 Tax=Vitis rotundifolia TaxID=103349 RepID=A0AA39DMA6_VITRO|nr:hypothetical protein PVL29_014674 [Vitis rotundifolia]
MKKWPAQKDTNIAAMEIRSNDKPPRSFVGKAVLKSFSRYLDVRIPRKITKEVTEEQREISDEIENTRNAGSFPRTGFPLSMPPGTVADVAKATVAISAATTEHDFEVSFSHPPPRSTSALCVSVKTSTAVSPALLYNIKFGGMELFTCCNHETSYTILMIFINNPLTRRSIIVYLGRKK